MLCPKSVGLDLSKSALQHALVERPLCERVVAAQLPEAGCLDSFVNMWIKRDWLCKLVASRQDTRKPRHSSCSCLTPS